MALSRKRVARGVAAMRRELRAKDRARLLELRGAVKAARLRKRDRVSKIRAMCRAERARLAAERRDLGNSCPLSLLVARRAGDDEVGAAVREYVAARDAAKGRRSPRMVKAAKRVRSLTRARSVSESWIRRRERDEFVEKEIPAELVPVWRRVRSQIKATPRVTRAEAFLDWAHDHSARVAEIKHAADEKAADRAWREHQRLQADVSRGRYRRCKVGTACALSEYVDPAEFSD